MAVLAPSILDIKPGFEYYQTSLVKGGHEFWIDWVWTR